MQTQPQKTKINIVTLGCSKNLVDSEFLMGQLKNHNFEIEHNANTPSDIVVINTCGFINDAKEESIDTILDFVRAREAGQISKIYVMGCLSQRYKSDLEKEIPEVDAYFGVNQMTEILRTLQVDYKNQLLGERLITTPSHYAYLKIAEGCDRKCSFCAIPRIRGKHNSRSIEDICTEARQLAQKGVKELILISQDLTYYGKDKTKGGQLNELLQELVGIKELRWIRLQYLFPAHFPVEILDTINRHEQICNYIDIPLQHINERILKSMRRGISKKETLDLIRLIRARIPGVALRTTLITGYPGESQAEFDELKHFVKETAFERLGVFSYSHEEDTPAFRLKDNISASKKINRKDELMLLQQRISEKKNAALIGTSMEVLIDRKEGDLYMGRSRSDSPEVDNEILLQSQNRPLSIGGFYKAIITSAEAYDLYARVLD